MATDVAEAKECRMDLRMTKKQRTQIERAAQLKGMSITQWSLDQLMDAARHDIEDESTLRLSDQAYDAFVAALEEPLPSETLELLSRKPVWE